MTGYRGWFGAALAVGLLAGCGSGPETAAGPGPTGVSSTGPSGTGPTVPVPTVPVPTVTPSVPRSPTDAAIPPDTPEPATAPPPSTAGPLSARNLPTAAALGGGWRVYADPGGAEKGFQGNGTWTRRRNAHQAAFEALPIGCAKPLPDTALPVPRYALQGAYRNPRGGPATVLAFRFASAAQASSYFAGYRARMTACGAPRDGGFQGLAVLPMWSAPASAAVVRKYTGAETFVEVSVVRGASVALLATSSGEPRSELVWTRTVAPRLAAVVDGQG